MIRDTVLRNRYKILQFLGGGAFGETYLAEDLDLPNHPKFVVKHLKPKTSELEVLQVAKRLFESEAKILYKLGNLSQQIPKLFAHFQEDNEFYLVQEFVDGYDLSAEIIPDKKWTEAEVIKLLKEILEVLALVHQQNIIHRDIKPQNLMRCKEDGKIVLIDFGAVKEIKGLVANSQGHVTSTIIIGSNGYMPNEQANSKPKLSSDIYAVGIIGIQALTGKLPQELKLLEDPNSGEIVWQNEVKVSKKLTNILTKMVYYNFSQRYQSATEALDAVKSLSSIPFLCSFFTFTVQKLVLHKKFLISGCFSVVMLMGLVFTLINFLNRPVTVIKPTKSITSVTKSPQPHVTLVCPAISLPPLPSKPDMEVNKTKYYGFSKNQGTGKGIIILPDENRYDGEIKEYEFNGCGTYTFANGDRYIGQFKDGKYEGNGKFICKNDVQYVGNFQNGKLLDRQVNCK